MIPNAVSVHRMGLVMGKLHFSLEKIEDENLRQVLYNMTRSLDAQVTAPFSGKHVAYMLRHGINKFPHNLPFTPRDMWFTGIWPEQGTADVKITAVDKTEVTIMVTLSAVNSLVEVRMFMGRMQEGS